jgi:hypothetical protein
MSVLAKYKFTEEQIDEKLQQKLDKWKNLINKK